MPDPNGQDSWEHPYIDGAKLRAGDLTIPPRKHWRIEVKECPECVLLREQLQHMTLRINSLERSSFTGMS